MYYKYMYLACIKIDTKLGMMWHGFWQWTLPLKNICKNHSNNVFIDDLEMFMHYVQGWWANGLPGFTVVATLQRLNRAETAHGT